MNDILRQFSDFLLDHGVSPPSQLVADGALHRCGTLDRPRAQDASYVLHHDDFPAGGCRNFRDGTETFHTWHAKLNRKLTTEEKEIRSAQVKTLKLAAERERIERMKESATEAALLWSLAKPAEDTFPYLIRKKAKAFGLRQHDDALLIPVFNETGSIVNLQKIYAEKNGSGKDKYFLPGGRVKGCSFRMGEKNSLIFVAEGYATAATIHELTGETVYVAFDAGNIQPVTENIRDAFPEAQIVIAADNDAWGIKNAGLIAAKKTASLVKNTTLIFPEFDEQFVVNEPTDFNDMILLTGDVNTKSYILQKIGQKNEVVIQTDTGIDYYNPLPELKDDGKPFATLSNLREIIRRAGIILRYNVISKDEEIIIPNQSFSLDNGMNAAQAVLTSEAYRFGFGTAPLQSYTTKLADENLYNPVATWVTSRPWDKQSRLQNFYNSVKAQSEDDPDSEDGQNNAALKELLMKRWMVSAVAAAFEPNGVSAHGMLVFQGIQNQGKTYWLKKLAPEYLKLVKDGVILRLDDRDSVRQCLSFWIVELGELEGTFKKSEMAQLKAFVTSDSDILRNPYARCNSRYGRRTVLAASVNKPEFLSDTTGNRRFWTIPCQSINPLHGLDMQQVWAEFFVMYKNKEPWTLAKEENDLLSDSNKHFETPDPYEEKIMDSYEWSTLSQPRLIEDWKTASEIAHDIQVDKPNKGDLNRIAEIIRKMNGNKTRIRQGRKQLLMPKKNI